MVARSSILSATIILVLGAFQYILIVAEVFWKKEGMQLKATDLIEETTDMEYEECLGVCLSNPNCKAFNVHLSNSNSPTKCYFFGVNKCSSSTKLIPSEGVSYFDTIGDKECPSELRWFIILLFLHNTQLSEINMST